MSNIQKIGIVGRISEELCDGQTVKTRILVHELHKYYPDCKIVIAESSDFKNKPYAVILQMIRCLRECDVVFVLLSRNGIRVLFPLLHLLNKIWKKPLFHDCIGGSLDEVVKLYPSIARYLNKFDVNWVETQHLKDKLDNLGICNVEVLPNFKPLECLSPNDLQLHSTIPFRFCTFSRVNHAKGIGDAVQAVLDINHDVSELRAMLDIYGPIEDGYEVELNRLIKDSNGAVQYKGVVNYSDSICVLKDYFMLLFPTRFFGEGFPGTLIDAFSAGLPVIATDWHCNGEIISDGYTGFLYPTDEPHRLRTLMEEAMQNPEQIFEMGKNCLEEVQKYSADVVMQIICERIQKIGCSNL